MRKTSTLAAVAATLITGILLAAPPAQAAPTPPKDVDSVINTVTFGKCQNVNEVIAVPVDLISKQQVC